MNNDGRHMKMQPKMDQESASALVIAASDKAGMDGIDRARIDAIILRESGDSAYMKQQRKRDQAVNEKIEQMKRRLHEHEQSAAGRNWRTSVERQLEPEILQLTQARRPRSTCVVVDMDMFYMACELLTRPELTEVPACVGSGMILTSNYCARKYGVRSAMASWIGDKLVSELTNGTQRLVHIPSNFDLYTLKSHEVRNVLAEYDPQLRAYSLDEAYLDVGAYVVLQLENSDWTHEQIRDALVVRHKARESEETPSTEPERIENDEKPHYSIDDELCRFPSQLVLTTASKVVEEMRKKVKEATGGLTCSAGLASNFMLAKIASDKNKPNGQLVVGPSSQDILDFVNELPTRKIPGIGRVTDKMLHAFGITTVQQLYEQRALVRFLFTPATARFLLSVSLGHSSSSSTGGGGGGGEASERKGIGRERTFSPGQPWPQVLSRLEDIARRLSTDMVAKDLRAHTITVKVKLHTFDVFNRSRTVPRGVHLQQSDELVKLATELVLELKKQHKGTFSVRLLGVRCSNFQGDDERAEDVHQMNMDQFLCSPRKEGTKRSASPIPQPRAPAYDDKSTTRQRQLPVSVPSTHRAAVHDRAQGALEKQSCPMCGQVIREQDNDAINRHVDSCLNSAMVRQAIQEESLAASERSKKRRLTDFFAAH
jgi:DNA polymerase kappa